MRAGAAATRARRTAGTVARRRRRHRGHELLASQRGVVVRVGAREVEAVDGVAFLAVDRAVTVLVGLRKADLIRAVIARRLLSHRGGCG